MQMGKKNTVSVIAVIGFISNEEAPDGTVPPLKKIQKDATVLALVPSEGKKKGALS
jgi:hypothetical protein